MNRVKKIFSLVHLVLWTLFSLLISLQLWTDDDHDWLPLTIGFILTCLYSFYAHFYLLTNYSGKKKDRNYFLVLAAILATGPLPVVLVHRASPDPFNLYVLNLPSTAVFIFLGWVARVTETLVLNTIRKEQLEKQAAEAELSSLRYQVNPHFLFNTLHNIHTLVYTQAATAPEAVLRLASMMRYMTYESNARTVPLEREITYLQDYIALQQMRYKSAMVVNFQKTGATERCFVAPLLFIHFLENAYKHSPPRLETGDIRLQIEVKDGTLIFICENPVGSGNKNALDEPGGVGLPNIRKRLALIYPGKHTLDIKSSGKIFSVTLTIHDLHLQDHEREADLLHN